MAITPLWSEGHMPLGPQWGSYQLGLFKYTLQRRIQGHISNAISEPDHPPGIHFPFRQRQDACQQINLGTRCGRKRPD